MPRRKDIKKVLVIGSGPIVIGQAAEFDYAGTQACLALKEEGYEVILANSNPATIMTDTHIADKVYMEPLTLEYVAKIIRFERPDAIVPGLGGQTGLNLAVQLAKKGILKECQVEILGTSFESIERAEDRELFKELCESLGEPVLPSHIAMSIEEAVAVAEEIGYPVVLRPAFTLGGTGGGFADDETELREMFPRAAVLACAYGRPAGNFARNAKLLAERAKRVAESGRDAVLLVDSLDALARVFREAPAQNAVYECEKLFTVGRQLRGAGSVTVLAVAPDEAGEIAQACAGAANAVLYLAEEAAAPGVYPAIDFFRSATRRAETLLREEEAAFARTLRETLADEGAAAMLRRAQEGPQN